MTLNIFCKFGIIYIKYRNKKFLNFLFVFFSIYCLKIVEKHFVQFNNFDKKNCRFQFFSIICRLKLTLFPHLEFQQIAHDQHPCNSISNSHWFQILFRLISHQGGIIVLELKSHWSYILITQQYITVKPGAWPFFSSS